MAQQGRGGQKTDVILEEISGTASQTIDEVRRIAYNLRPYQIEEIGLTRAIQGMLRRTGESTEIEIARKLDNIDGVFSPENEINLFRIIQESLANIVRHSGASKTSVAIERNDSAISIRIEDDGQGFSVEDLTGKRGLGLTGIEERARILGGAAGITSTAGKGTVIHVKIDL
jgi:signal transduction histidine kinase